MFEMMSGRLPFFANSPDEIKRLIVSEPVTMPRGLGREGGKVKSAN